jgi:hypothetical protein
LGVRWLAWREAVVRRREGIQVPRRRTRRRPRQPFDDDEFDDDDD